MSCSYYGWVVKAVKIVISFEKRCMFNRISYWLNLTFLFSFCDDVSKTIMSTCSKGKCMNVFMRWCQRFILWRPSAILFILGTPSHFSKLTISTLSSHYRFGLLCSGNIFGINGQTICGGIFKCLLPMVHQVKKLHDSLRQDRQFGVGLHRFWYLGPNMPSRYESYATYIPE